MVERVCDRASQNRNILLSNLTLEHNTVILTYKSKSTMQVLVKYQNSWTGNPQATVRCGFRAQKDT